MRAQRYRDVSQLNPSVYCHVACALNVKHYMVCTWNSCSMHAHLGRAAARAHHADVREALLATMHNGYVAMFFDARAAHRAGPESYL